MALIMKVLLLQDLKIREEAAAALRLEEEKIIQEQIALEKIQKQREKMEEHRKQLQLQRLVESYNLRLYSLEFI